MLTCWDKFAKIFRFTTCSNFKKGAESPEPLQIIAEIKDLIFNDISSFKDCFLKFSANQSSDSELHQQQILFLQKELTDKDNMIQCLLTHYLNKPISFKSNTMSYKEKY